MRPAGRRFRSNRGTSLIEVLLASGIALIVFTSVLSTLLGITAMTAMAQHYSQAMNVVRGKVEELKGTDFTQVVNQNIANVSYDAGEDNVFGNADDLKGSFVIEVRDRLDLDGDNDTAEATIDVDGDGVNDCIDFPACTDPYAKPVRVTFTWSQHLWSVNKNMSVSVDTVIAQ